MTLVTASQQVETPGRSACSRHSDHGRYDKSNRCRMPARRTDCLRTRNIRFGFQRRDEHRYAGSLFFGTRKYTHHAGRTTVKQLHHKCHFTGLQHQHGKNQANRSTPRTGFLSLRECGSDSSHQYRHQKRYGHPQWFHIRQSPEVTAG